MSTARTDRSDISSVTNIDEKLLLIAHTRTSFVSTIDNTNTKRTDVNSVLGALEGEEMDGQEESETPGLEGNTHRSDCNSGYLSSSGTGRGKDRVFPLIPHLVGSPFNTSNTSPPAINTSTPPSITVAAGGAGGAASGGGTGTGSGSGTGGSSISPTSKSSPMRRLSNRLSERAIGLFGFLRGGSHHRSSVSLATPSHDVDYLNGTRQTSILSSCNMNSRSHHFDAEHTPLDTASSSRKYSHYLDFESMDEVIESRSNRRLASGCSPASFAGCSANRISKGINAASRASLALSEDFDDCGTVTPFDPQSRHSSLYEITSATPQHHTAPHSAYSSMLGIEQIQSPRGSIPSGTPNSSGNEIEIITDSDLIWDLPYTPYIPYNSPDQVTNHVNVRADVHVHVDEQDIHPHDDLTSHTPTHSSFPFPISPSKRRNGTRNGSLTSLTSIATTGSTSPEKYPYDKTAGWFNVGRSGFNKDKDRDKDRGIPMPSSSHLRLKDGTYVKATHVQ